MTRWTYPLLGLALLLVIVIAGVIGGPYFAPDMAVDRWFIGWRAGHVDQTRAILAFTQLGGSLVLVPVVLIATGWLWWRGERREALLFFATTMSGRAMVELIKWAVDRPRPSFDPYPVIVSVKSFPSGHASNSTLTLVSLALFVAPARWRAAALTAGIALAVAIGCTRPVLGVHWPTDIIAGWCFGLLWVGAWWRLSRRGEAAASGYSPASPADGRG
ncbi:MULTISPECIES: phosphatase PAP2 family protein [Sphingomonas]|uniref:phosphatase PAP2 family protein n=1 Tax=Sphingomonas TaxID=13687 RepID=UPI000DEEF248|nr:MULTISPECIES: phosphatase PAP2 family protein [Sphingomonas]